MRKKKDKNSCEVLSYFSRGGSRKKGQVPSTLVAVIVMLVLLVALLVIALVLYKGGGGEILKSMRNVFRFGR